MKSIQRTRNFIIAAFLLSLLFHASSILYVVIQRTHQPNQKELSEQDELHNPTINNKKDEWAETKAHASNFGAPVMFEDISSFAEASSVAKAMEDTTADRPEVSKDNLNEVEPEPIEKTEEKIIKKMMPEEITVKEEKKQPLTHNKPLPKKRPPRKPYSAKATKGLPEDRQKKLTPAPKPPLSLAQLTQGFLNHIKNEGNHAIHMLGKKSGTPSDEQIKYERYLEKLSWCLHNSFNIHNHRFPPSATRESIVYISLALNQDGTMRHCNVAKTSGDVQLDQFTLFIFNDASTSFPPVPHYLPHDPFTITYVITHNASEQNGMRLYRR